MRLTGQSRAAMRTAPPVTPRAGRNLPAAIGVGVLLGSVVLGSLFLAKWAFVAFTVVATMVAVGELARALHARPSTADPIAAVAAVPPSAMPLAAIPLAVGAGAVVVAAYAGGTQALVVATLLLAVAAAVWGVVSTGADALAQIGADVFVACYVALLAGFAVLLVVPADGPRRVAAFVAAVVCSDTGGYAVGVFLGKHPMAPTVSPKKSWEGFAGSVTAGSVSGGLLLPLTLHATWWQGVLFGLAVVVAATIGDLSESLIKRDLGIKDMGQLLPGHGGVMDRLDSLLLAAPVAWGLLTFFVPWPR